MDIRKLRHVSVLAETLHFGQAAERVHLTQSALSRSVLALEDEIGLRLFDRDRSGVRLTAAGRQLVEQMRPLLRSAGHLVQHMALLREGAAGALAIGAGPFPAATLVPEALLVLQASHPGLHVTLRVDHSESLAQQLAREEIEMFVADVRRATPLPDGVRVQPLCVHHGGLFCRAGHPLARRRALAPADLAGQRIAAVQLPPPLAKALRKLAGGAAPPGVTCDNVYLLKELARRSDVLLACTREALHAELARREFVELRWPALPPVAVTLGIATLEGRTRSPAAALFIETLLASAQRP